MRKKGDKNECLLFTNNEKVDKIYLTQIHRRGGCYYAR